MNVEKEDSMEEIAKKEGMDKTKEQRREEFQKFYREFLNAHSEFDEQLDEQERGKRKEISFFMSSKKKKEKEKNIRESRYRERNKFMQEWKDKYLKEVATPQEKEYLKLDEEVQSYKNEQHGKDIAEPFFRGRRSEEAEERLKQFNEKNEKREKLKEEIDPERTALLYDWS